MQNNLGTYLYPDYDWVLDPDLESENHWNTRQ